MCSDSETEGTCLAAVVGGKRQAKVTRPRLFSALLQFGFQSEQHKQTKEFCVFFQDGFPGGSRVCAGNMSSKRDKPCMFVCVCIYNINVYVCVWLQQASTNVSNRNQLCRTAWRDAADDLWNHSHAHATRSVTHFTL